MSEPSENSLKGSAHQFRHEITQPRTAASSLQNHGDPSLTSRPMPPLQYGETTHQHPVDIIRTPDHLPIPQGYAQTQVYNQYQGSMRPGSQSANLSGQPSSYATSYGRAQSSLQTQRPTNYPHRPAHLHQESSHNSYNPNDDSRRPDSHQTSQLLPGRPHQSHAASSAVRDPDIPNLIDADRAHARAGIRFDLTIRQQPKAARACGSGERDRRNIDPPPVVQLHITAPAMSSDEVSRYLSYEGYIMNCWIYDESGRIELSDMPTEYRSQRRLTGSLISTPFYGRDDSGQPGCFFILSDLSVRTLGRYRLKFTMVMLDLALSTRNKHFPILAEVMSDTFDVYTAKDFPGITESSSLVRALREQGCIVPIKKGNEKTKKRGQARAGESDEDENDDS